MLFGFFKISGSIKASDNPETILASIQLAIKSPNPNLHSTGLFFSRSFQESKINKSKKMFGGKTVCVKLYYAQEYFR